MRWLGRLRQIRDVLTIGSCLIAPALFSGPACAQQTPPNILLILGDNIGYGDVGAYGGGELRGAPTPHIDQFAAEGLRLTQFLVEPSCTPSRAALMTGRYSVRSGLSLVAVAGTDISLPAKEITMAEMLHDAGYATAIFGKWHLGGQTYSQPQNQGFDEFYGIPPNDTWDAFGMIRQGRQTQSLDIPIDKGPQIVEARRGEPLKPVKPYTEEVRRGIDWELVDHGIDFMKRETAAGKPFFLYLPISRTHFPNLPSKPFEGVSRIGQFGDSLMECDAIIGKLLDSLKELGLDEDTIVILASDNGPDGPGARAFGGDMPDVGSSGPYRGALGDVSEGAIRTIAMIRWPHRVSPRSSYAMFSIMDFFPTLAHLAGGKVPDDRPVDGVDQSDLLLGKNNTGARDHLLTFVGADLVAVRWKQFRAYFADVAPGRSGAGGATLMGGVGASAAPMNGYPKVFNIESDPQEEHNIGEMYNWVLGPLLGTVEEYKATLAKAPNPPAANMTKF
ncbi:arylsulfatase [Neorhizobium sp. P12A]|uniref:arylsulfatase n=1 Tax=Neorhizobium sp. P12A TaxID=2268027 RepID=UPI0011EFEFA4|nr:arylsulfatase [Neorhizobium sp. P12A]KAA0693386.1 arylsulfatase [Neorhizobium sp. P12A]